MTWNPNDLTQFIVKGVNAKTTGSTLIGTTKSASGLFIPTFAIFHVVGSSVIAVPATVCIGTNSTSYNNILTATALTGLTALDTIIRLTLGVAAISAIAASTGIYVNVTSGATATTMNIDVTLFGFYK